MTFARLLRIARQRVRAVLHRDDLDAQLDRELAFHLEQLTSEKVAGGLPIDEARRAARREFGNPLLIAERSRDERRVNWIHDLRHDLLYGLRMLRRSPGFTIVALVSLAFGIGGNAAMLGALRTAFVHTQPFAHADRLVIVRTFALDNPRQMEGAFALDYALWKDRTRTLQEVGASLSGPRLFDAEPGGLAGERVTGLSITPGLFATLGVVPLKGRLFDAARTMAGDELPPVVISHRLWQRRFGGAADVVGRQVSIDGNPRRIIGVMPPEFRYLSDDIDCWMPMLIVVSPDRPPAGGRFFVVAGRLAPGVTVAQAQADLDAIAADVATEFPEGHRGRGVRVQPLRQAMYGWTKAPLVTLQAALALVLVIVWTNMAGLFLARATVRRPEMALRAALGASRSRIVRQLLAESLLVSAAAGVLALLVASGVLLALTAALAPPPGAPRIDLMAGFDWRLFTVVAALSLLSPLAFALAPALACGNLDLAGALNAPAPRAGTHPRSHRRRSVLVAAQIALALVLLVAAGLMSKSFLRLAGRNINMDTKGVLTFEYAIPAAAYAKQPERNAAYRFRIDPPPSATIARVFDRLRGLPGVVSVAGISYPPVNSLVLPIAHVVVPAGGDERPHPVAYFLVTPHFFSTVRTTVVRGREIDGRDTLASSWVAVVNESMARRFWPGERAIGRHVRIADGPEERDREVVGVVRDIPTRLNQLDPEPVIYASYLQQPPGYTGQWVGMFGQMTFVVRHRGDAAVVLASARGAVAEVDPRRPIVGVGTIDRHLTANRRESRNYVLAFAVFALTATLLSAIGIYGVTAYAVSERTREIAVRRALGAGVGEIAALVARRVLAPILAGLAAGLAGALAFTRLIGTQLWNVTGTDPATYAGMVLLLACTAFLACLAPSRRAIAVDPSVVLHGE